MRPSAGKALKIGLQGLEFLFPCMNAIVQIQFLKYILNHYGVKYEFVMGSLGDLKTTLKRH